MFEKTPLPDLTIVRPKRHGDARGWFSETWSRRAFEDAGLSFDWCQDNHAYSRQAGVLRGLHYQAPPSAQAKLVRAVAGRIWDVAVDVRRGSPTEKQSFGVELSAENGAQLLVPQGFLHGYLTLEPNSEVVYKVDAFYDREADGAVAWDDPDLAVEWPLDLLAEGPVISEKDARATRYADWQSPFVWED